MGIKFYFCFARFYSLGLFLYSHSSSEIMVLWKLFLSSPLSLLVSFFPFTLLFLHSFLAFPILTLSSYLFIPVFLGQVSLCPRVAFHGAKEHHELLMLLPPIPQSQDH